MCIIYFKKKLRNGYKAFCEQTSLHGFTELYRAKSCFWKFIWLLLLIGAFTATGFQLYISVNEYRNQITTTSLQTAAEDDIIFPPLKYCIGHWLFWLKNQQDIKPVMTMETLLIALSRLTKINAESAFNVTEAESDLIRIFETVGKKYTINDFFIENALEMDIYSEKFKDKELVPDDSSVLLCYTMNETRIRYFLQQDKIIDLYFEYLKDSNIFETFTERELIAYYYDWCAQSGCNDIFSENDSLITIYNTIRQFGPSDKLIIDGYNKQSFSMSNHFSAYSVLLRLTVQKWLPDGSKQCNADIKSFYSYKTCEEKCRMKSFPYRDDQNISTPCKSLRTLILLEEEMSSLKYVCKLQIKSINPYEDPLAIEEIPGISNTTFINECMKNCSTGCNIYKWEMSVLATEFKTYSTTIRVVIQYPTVDMVLVFQEVPRKTWDEFVSDIGGLLGIWTGASILSLFQLIYVFCSAAGDDTPTMAMVAPKFESNKHVSMNAA